MKNRTKTNKRKWIKKLHLWLGLSSGPIVFLLAITGCVYAFQMEIKAYLRADALYADVVLEEPLPIDRLWEATAEKLGNSYPLSKLIISSDATKNWIFPIYVKSQSPSITYFGGVEQWNSVYVNPYNGKIESIIDEEKDFFQIVKLLHWSLLLNTEIGQPIVGVATLLFFILLISGLILWWPKSKKAAKQRFTFQWKEGTKRKRKNYDLHNILGFYVITVLLVLSISGMVWAFDTVKKIVYVTAAQTAEPPEYAEVKSLPQKEQVKNVLQKVWEGGTADFPGAATVMITAAADSLAPIQLQIQERKGRYDVLHKQLYDQYSGELLHDRRHADKNAGEKLITANYDIHTGAILGLGGKVIMFIASLVCATLPISGFLIWYWRK